MFYTQDALERLSREQLLEICRSINAQCNEQDTQEVLIGIILRHNVYTYQELNEIDPTLLIKLTHKYMYEITEKNFLNNSLQKVSKEQVIKSIIQKQIQRHPKLCEDEIITFQRYQKDSSLFNEFLRNTHKIPSDFELYKYITKDNMETLFCIKMFDDMTQTATGWRDNWKDQYFYRGINGYEKNLITTLIRTEEKGSGAIFTLFKKEYLSCSINILCALRFSESECCLLRFQIPENIKYYNGIKKGTRDEGELVLQRNILVYAFERKGEFFRGVEIIDCKIET